MSVHRGETLAELDLLPSSQLVIVALKKEGKGAIHRPHPLVEAPRCLSWRVREHSVVEAEEIIRELASDEERLCCRPRCFGE